MNVQASTNPYFTLTPDARRTLCEAALLRYCPRKVEPIVTYHGDVPFAELPPKTQAALASMIEAAIKAIENGNYH